MEQRDGTAPGSVRVCVRTAFYARVANAREPHLMAAGSRRSELPTRHPNRRAARTHGPAILMAPLCSCEMYLHRNLH